MNIRILLATAVVSASCSIASAEPVMRPPQVIADALPPYEVMTIIRSTGFEPLGRPMRRGHLYELHALDPYEMDVVLLVDARTGRIVSVEDGGDLGEVYARGPAVVPPYGGPPRPPAPIGRSFSYSGPYGEPPPPVPPRAVPGGQRAAPARPPLPRTRPAEATANAKVAARPAEVTGSTPPATPPEASPPAPQPAGVAPQATPMPPVQPLE